MEDLLTASNVSVFVSVMAYGAAVLVWVGAVLHQEERRESRDRPPPRSRQPAHRQRAVEEEVVLRHSDARHERTQRSA